MLNYWSIWSNCRGGSWPLSMNTNDPMQWLWKQTKISPQPLCLVDERPLIQVWEQFPVGPESLWDFRVVHLRVLLGHLSPLAARPDHESIHRSLDMVARLWSRTHHLLLEDGANWARTRRREPFLPLLAKYIPILGLQLSWILDPLEPRTSKNKTLEFFWERIKVKQHGRWWKHNWSLGGSGLATLGFWPIAQLWLDGGVWASTAIGWGTMGGVVTWASPTMGRTVTWYTWINEDVPAMRRRPTNNDGLWANKSDLPWVVLGHRIGLWTSGRKDKIC